MELFAKKGKLIPRQNLGKTWGQGLGPNLSSALSRRASGLSVCLCLSVLQPGSPRPRVALSPQTSIPHCCGGVPLRGELRLAKARYSPLAERMMGYRRGAGVIPPPRVTARRTRFCADFREKPEEEVEPCCAGQQRSAQRRLSSGNERAQPILFSPV